MDYLTKPITRAELREIASIFRQMYNAPSTGMFPVLEALELFPTIFKGSSWEVVENTEMPASLPAECIVNIDGTFTIKIRQETYDGARKGIGAFRNHIVHELCHSFLYFLGYTPVMQRSFGNGEISCYCSSEWQAKALCGEVMMPYEESMDMEYAELINYYGVSKGSAWYRYSKY